MTTSVLEIVRALYPFRYSIVSPDNDRAIAEYLKYLDFDIHEYPSGETLNGWTIPNSWWVEKAEIRTGNKVIYNAMEKPLGVAALSRSFTGSVKLPELKQHLSYTQSDESAVPYHWRFLYRDHERDWMFCMSSKQIRELEDASYDIDLVTGSADGTMKVLDFRLAGTSNDTILLNAHNCHPWQANDDISGVAVGIAALERLSQLPNRHYTYRLVIGPELIGTAFWLDHNKGVASSIKSAIMLKAIGNDRDLRLQHSFTGSAEIDRVAQHVFKHKFGQFDSGAFRTIYGNDETVFEAPPYNIPSIALTRFPFDEYHTDLDTPDKLSEERLEGAVEAVLEICDGLEKSIPFERNFDGLVCLSAHDLYLEFPADGASNISHPDQMRRWNHLMNSLPRYLDGVTPLVDVADLFGVSLNDLYSYLCRWETAGLVRRPGMLEEPSSTDANVL